MLPEPVEMSDDIYDFMVSSRRSWKHHRFFTIACAVEMTLCLPSWHYPPIILYWPTVSEIHREPSADSVARMLASLRQRYRTTGATGFVRKYADMSSPDPQRYQKWQNSDNRVLTCARFRHDENLPSMGAWVEASDGKLRVM